LAGYQELHAAAGRTAWAPASAAARPALRGPLWDAAWRAEEEAQVAFLGCLFGDLLHPVSLDAAWLRWNGSVVERLARAVYDEQAFDRLPVLADALEEAGCSDARLLGHLRSPGPHARGCFVVDAILGKS
jgi:hypothetical protein